jgi:NAD+ synthase
MKSEYFYSFLFKSSESILKAQPDGLYGNEKREDQLGASYDELEWAMLHVESGQSDYFNERQKASLCYIQKLNTTNQHKMNYRL